MPRSSLGDQLAVWDGRDSLSGLGWHALRDYLKGSYVAFKRVTP